MHEKRKKKQKKHREDKEITKNNKHYISVFSTVTHAVFPLALIIHGSNPARFLFQINKSNRQDSRYKHCIK